MNRPTAITATYRIVTPMFCAGADQQSAELRLASFKGALRFWWRTLMAGKFGNDIEGLHKAEAELFGSSDRRFGQSKVRMRLRWRSKIPAKSELVTEWPANQPAIGSTYLGYGITESGKKGSPTYKPHRIGLPEGREFEVKCIGNERDLASVLPALKIVGMLGGLGSRSRRAFGSIALEYLDEDSFEFKNADGFRAFINSLVHEPCPILPEFTAFGSHARLYVGPAAESARESHRLLGETYRNFRGLPSPLRGRSKIPMGLPLQGVDSRRRASPLLMHIHPVADQFMPVVLFLPSVFHPEIREGNQFGFFQVVQQWMESLNATEVKLG
ncbi:type III-B CRISPR module RAMP protein Cmr1 [Allorhodopirellula heiligendammensis]|nr:type III-B CRISPR module RAMP protein Cmr1 [Allorhodopirellula heiligendammensis]